MNEPWTRTVTLDWIIWAFRDVMQDALKHHDNDTARALAWTASLGFEERIKDSFPGAGELIMERPTYAPPADDEASEAAE